MNRKDEDALLAAFRKMNKEARETILIIAEKYADAMPGEALPKLRLVSSS